jgi:DNA-binding transcriptional MerR regulator
MTDSLLSTADLARRFNLPERTITHWRETRTGPPFIRLGSRVRYRAQDVEKWLDQQAKASGWSA